MRVFEIIVGINEYTIEDEDNTFPFAINLFRRCDSYTGKFFCLLFLGWLMLPELCLLGLVYIFAFLFAFVISCIPILNIFLLFDSLSEDDTLSVVMCFIGILIDVVVIVAGLIMYFFFRDYFNYLMRNWFGINTYLAILRY